MCGTWQPNLCVACCFLACGVVRIREQVWNEFGERMKIYAKQKRKWREESVRRYKFGRKRCGRGVQFKSHQVKTRGETIDEGVP